MFKKLKEKITEEVKSSPQRFQQLTQSVSDRLQNSSTSDENFFSIGDDDANVSNPSHEPGFTSVSLMSPQESKPRRNSSSSVASDVSFLPRYESFVNMYHLQSDLDVSASEMEDNASSSSQLGHLSKEQIYSAFQKAQMRYHKYRGRYTDLAKHYKDLERDNVKMKSVLVETQDKAIRRVTELKEQCVLEQNAKAHLESALRDEIDEKQMKIQSLQTKIGLLQNGPAIVQDTDNLENLNKYLTEARQEIENLNEKIQEMKANAIIFQTKEQDYKTKITSLEKEILLYSEREKESNLNFAQNKMDLHNELLNKDNEITGLKQDLEALRKSTDTGGNGKLENLQTQNKKLIEKVENLTQKCNGYENELLKMEQFKMEVQASTQANAELKNQLKEAEEKLLMVRDEARKSLLSLEGKIRKELQTQFDGKEEELKDEFNKKLEEISSKTDNLNEIRLELLEREQEIKQLREVNERMLGELTAKSDKYNDLESNHLGLIEDSVSLRNKISNLEKQVTEGQNNNNASEMKITQLKKNVASLEKDLEGFKQLQQKMEELKTENDNLLQARRDEEESDQCEQVTALEEEKRRLLKELEEVQSKHRESLKMCEEVDSLRKSLQKCEECLADTKKELEEERRKLHQAVQEHASVLVNFENANLSLTEEIRNLKAIAEESIQEKKQLSDKISAMVQELEESNRERSEKLELVQAERDSISEELAKSEKKIRDLEETNQKLSSKIRSIQKEMAYVTTNLHNERMQNKDKVENLQTEIEQLKRALENKSEESHQLVETHGKLQQLEEIINKLKAELAAAKELIESKDQEMSKCANEMQKQEENARRVNEEVSSLKAALEEARNNLSLKEQELLKVENEYSRAQENNAKLSKEIDDHLVKLQNQETQLKEKDLQMGKLTKKLEDHNELMHEKYEGFSRLLNHFSTEPLNNFRYAKDHKNLQNLEEKLQHFEQNFSLEKENLSRIIAYLKLYEEQYSSILSGKNALEEEREELLKQIHHLRTEGVSIRQIEEELRKAKEENIQLQENYTISTQNIFELEARNTQLVSDNTFLSEENIRLSNENAELKVQIEETLSKCGKAEVTVNELKTKVTELESDSTAANRLSELEHHVNELQHEKQLLQEEIEELKTAPINLTNNVNGEDCQQEIENLRTKIVQYKSLDLTNRSSIEFYENELQKLKTQNEKLSRKLDETLVTLNHCSELSQSTEIEYLKNVLYNYMLGKESLVLARVIAAVCKFDSQQTETVLAKEQQKQTLLGQLGIL